MSDDMEERMRTLETEAAVNKAMVARMEQDLKSIAQSLQSIQQVVTKWRGGLGVIVIALGTISVVAELLVRKLFP